MGTAFVATMGLSTGARIAAALARHAGQVVWLCDGVDAVDAHAPDGPRRVEARFDSRVALDLAFAAAARLGGAPDQIVLSALPQAALEAVAIESLDPAAWSRACNDALKALLFGLQASHAQLRGRGGSVVVLGPTLALAGAPTLVPLCTALEGQRGLVKSCARQWGRESISVNWIAAAPLALSPCFEGLPLPHRPDAVPVAFGQAPALEEGVVPLIEFLASAGGRRLTGATLLADGGEWMLP